MDEYEKSAIIGYYRSCATISEMVIITGISFTEIEKYIQYYLKHKEKSSNP